jgi:hypothetical protein
MALVLTAAAHYLILLVPAPSPLYPWFVSCTTTASILMHADEEVQLFYVIDYGLTGGWVLLDLLLAMITYDLGIMIQVAYLNLAIFALHEFQKASVQNRRDYVYYHSLWHLLSAAKGIAVALLLQNPAHQGRQEIGDVPYDVTIFNKYRIGQV